MLRHRKPDNPDDEGTPPGDGGTGEQRAAGGAADASEEGAPEMRAAEMEQALAAKQQELDARTKESAEYLDGWQRERASFENYRRRMARQLDDAGILAKVELIRHVLPAIDNLERALSDSTTDAEVVRKGVRMTHEQLMAMLAREGMQAVPSTGEAFDPNLHEAIDAVPDTGQEPGTVVEDVQKGYTFGEKLVRPARVRVAR